MEDRSAAGAGGGAGAAPFLVKTYEMIEDRSTDEIVSWSSNNNSFVVWNPPEFERLLLPTYFKHNNFSSFIRQLNTYGFRKIDPEKWEFANEEFLKDQKHLLKNIHRRKPIHSHSHPQGSSVVDPERAAFEEEIEKLSREKSALEADVLRSKQQRSTEKLQLEDLTQRVDGMEHRQEKLLSFLDKAIKNPTFIQYLTRKVESMDFSSYSKKRRLPQVDHCQQFSENSFLDNLSSSRPEFGNVIPQDCSNTVTLEFSPSRSDINLVSHSAQSSNEDGTPQINVPEEDPKYAQMMEECPLFAPETLELSDTGTSSKFRMECSLLQKMADGSGPRLLSLHQSLDTATIEDTDSHISCQLNLTLASSPLQVNRSHSMAKMVQANQELGRLSGSNANFQEKDFPHKNTGDEVEAPNTNQGHALVPQVQVNDGFWAQFFTERPGSSDIEEASSSLRAKTYNEKEDRRLGNEMFRNEKSMDQLTL